MIRICCWLMIFLTVMGAGCQQTPMVVHPPGGQSDSLCILARITDSDGGESISRLNSRVLVQSRGIEAVVSQGMTAMPTLIVILDDDRLSFDTFTRCYSACDQILRLADPTCKILWYGGCEIRHDGQDKDRITPGGQMDPGAFRKEVAVDISRNFVRLSSR